MNTPGISLFQGADALNINSTLDRQEEEEALQDQKRREEEVSDLGIPGKQCHRFQFYASLDGLW